jgi:drug/metabolite transporter (DMT)-like permease
MQKKASLVTAFESWLSSYDVLVSIITYSLCSGTLVLLNKLTLHHLPYPSLVVSFQLIATVVFIYTCKYTEVLRVDDIEWKYVKPYLYYIVTFSLGVYCNMRSLSISNVETIIVFRAISPCIVAILDVIFLGREYPSARSWSGLATIVIGAYGYACHDSKFQTQGYYAYLWPILYLFVISLEMVRRILAVYTNNCTTSLVEIYKIFSFRSCSCLKTIYFSVLRSNTNPSILCLSLASM